MKVGNQYTVTNDNKIANINCSPANGNFIIYTLISNSLLCRQLCFFLLQDPFAFLLTEFPGIIFVTKSQNRKPILKRLGKKTLKKDACGGG